jgi:hypothetical protein
MCPVGDKLLNGDQAVDGSDTRDREVSGSASGDEGDLGTLARMIQESPKLVPESNVAKRDSDSIEEFGPERIEARHD